MKRYFAYMSIILLSGCYWHSNDKNLEAISVLPKFDFMSIDSSRKLSSTSLSHNLPIIVLYFSPDCEHCRRETKEILSHMDRLKNTTLCWISNGSIDDLQSFYSQFRLDTLRNAVVGQDYQYSFYRTFLPSDVPYIVIYNNVNQLIKIYKGEVPIYNILSNVD